jgi:hypothetical protein
VRWLSHLDRPYGTGCEGWVNSAPWRQVRRKRSRLFANSLVQRTLRLEQVHQEHKRSEEQQNHDQGRGHDEEPVLPGMATPGLRVADEQVVVAPICFPRDVCDVADDGNRTERVFDREVEHHTEDGDARSSALPRRQDDEEGSEGGESVADAWNPADQRVQSEANARTRNFEAIIQPGCD